MSDKKTEPEIMTEAIPDITPDTACEHDAEANPHHRDLKLSHKDAQAGGPDDISIGGEEDPGVGLESLVEESQTDLCADNHHQP